MTIQNEFAKTLLALRVKNNFTQEQFAEILNISPRWYQKLESGRCLPNFIIMLKLINDFHMDISMLSQEEDAN